jgi:transcription antitermination factor NusG
MTWHVCTTRSGKEAGATHDLLTIGIEAYYPKEAGWKRTAKGRRRVESAIIPGYVFFRLNDPEEQQYLDTCDGVSGVLTAGRHDNGDRKLAIIVGWVETTREAERRGDFDRTIDRSVKAKVGDLIRITQGSFAGYLASVTASSKREFKVEIAATGRMKGLKISVEKSGVELAA